MSISLLSRGYLSNANICHGFLIAIGGILRFRVCVTQRSIALIWIAVAMLWREKSTLQISIDIILGIIILSELSTILLWLHSIVSLLVFLSVILFVLISSFLTFIVNVKWINRLQWVVCVVIYHILSVVFTLVHPSHSNTIFPFSFSFFAIWYYKDANAVLKTIFEVTFIASIVWVHVNSIAMSFILEKVSCVGAAIRPLVHTLAMHIILQPLANVDSSIFPDVLAISSDHILDPVALEDTVVGPPVDSIAPLHAFLVGTHVTSTILPYLLALAFLDVVDPFAFITGAIEMDIDAKTMGLVCEELTNIDVTTAMPKSAFAMGFIAAPFTFVNGTTFPLVDAITMTLHDFSLYDLIWFNWHLSDRHERWSVWNGFQIPIRLKTFLFLRLQILPLNSLFHLTFVRRAIIFENMLVHVIGSINLVKFWN